eukprot:SAG22_NODE_1927_length_3297_cov_3.294872_1_plen_49_part_10
MLLEKRALQQTNSITPVLCLKRRLLVADFHRALLGALYGTVFLLCFHCL